MTDSLVTWEVRWFSPGAPPEEVKRWFNEHCPGEMLPPEQRKDWYLAVPGCDYLNLKLREGNLEVKWRKAELGVHSFSDRLIGKVQQWVKWSCADSAEHISLPKSEQRWLQVAKARSQRQDQGVTYELTELEIRGNLWWSLAFEMVQDKEEQIEHFQEVVNGVSKTYPGAKLAADLSFAYPRWLSAR